MANLGVTIKLSQVLLPTGQRSGAGLCQGQRGSLNNPTLQFWHIPPMKRGCSRVTLRLPQEMQMSEKQRRRSERHHGAPLSPRTKASSRKATKRGCAGAAAKKVRQRGVREAQTQKPRHLSERQCHHPGVASYRDRNPPTRTGTCRWVTLEMALGQSLNPGPLPPSFPGLRAPSWIHHH